MKTETKSRENTVAMKNGIVLSEDLTPMYELSSEQLNRMFPAEVSCIGCGQLGRYLYRLPSHSTVLPTAAQSYPNGHLLK